MWRTVHQVGQRHDLACTRTGQTCPVSDLQRPSHSVLPDHQVFVRLGTGTNHWLRAMLAAIDRARLGSLPITEQCAPAEYRRRSWLGPGCAASLKLLGRVGDDPELRSASGRASGIVPAPSRAQVRQKQRER